jgi:hypothetical protein
MKGGHDTRRLLASGWPSSDYVFVEIASKPAAGSVARQFEQYKWCGPGAIPVSGSGRFPTDKGFDATGWVKSKMLKTTMDDPETLMSEAEDAWRRWLDAGAHPTGAENEFSAMTGRGVQISGFFDEAAKTPTTVFVEASWF